MKWNNRKVDFQIYREKNGNGFLIAFPDKKNYSKNVDVFCAIYEKPNPSYDCFCHSQASYDYIYSECYPISQAKLKKFPEWYKFFDGYIKEVNNA